MTPEVLAACAGASPDRAARFASVLSAAMDEFDIVTPACQAAFLAQIGHESGGLLYTSEIWGPTPAQMRYEGRVDLGNLMPGDGSKYRGRGLIQVTGRANYSRMGRALGLDLEARPELLAETGAAARSAACFWDAHGLNEYAEAGDFKQLTRRINGGLNGYDERLKLWAGAKAALGIAG